MNLKRKVLVEVAQMAGLMLMLAALGIYARDFVIHGIMAKPDLNGLIIVTFVFATGVAFYSALRLLTDVQALEALRTDFSYRSQADHSSVFDTPAIVFKRPSLLGYGYRLISEELHARRGARLGAETVHMLLGDVDHRIGEARARMGYLGGLLIFLGLLGAFMGLMKTVASVGDLIGSMDLSGSAGSDSIAGMIEGMKKPLAGMSVGFSSSLFGLMFSMVVGVLDRFVVAAMKSVRNEYEATLIDWTELETHHGVAPAHEGTAYAGPAATVSAGLPEDFARTALAALHRMQANTEKTQAQLAELNINVAAAMQTLAAEPRSERFETAV